MLVCDTCGKEIKVSKNVSGFNPKRDIHYMYSASAYQTKEVDMCHDCQLELKDELCKAEMNWYNHKMSIRGDRSDVCLD